MRTGMRAPVGAIVCLAVAGCAGGTRKAVQPGQAETTGAQAPASPAEPVTMEKLPAGTALTVRTVDMLSSETATEGTKFAAVLAAPITTATGEVVVPEGAKLFGRVTEASGGGAVTRPKLAIAIDQLQVGGRTVSVSTTSVGAEGGRGGAVRKIGAGTLIGAAAGSAGGGAAVGGAAALLGRGNEIVIKPGTLVEVRLTEAAPLQ